MFRSNSFRRSALLVAAVVLPVGSAAAQGGVVMRATPTAAAEPANRVHLSLEQARTIVVGRHLDVANGTSDDNVITLVLDANGNYVTSAASQATTAVATLHAVAGKLIAETSAAATLREQILTDTLQKLSAARATAAPATATATVTANPEARARTLTLAGIGTVDASLVRDMYWVNYAAGEVSVNAVRMRVITLVGNSLK